MNPNSFTTDNEVQAPGSVFDVISGRESVKVDTSILIPWETVFMAMVLIIATAAAATFTRKLFK